MFATALVDLSFLELILFKSNVQSSLTRMDVFVIYNKKKGMF